MIAALLGDEAARQRNDVAPNNRSHQSTGVQRLGENRQAAQRMIDPGKSILLDGGRLRRKIPARQHVDKTKQRHPQGFIVQRPFDHPAEQILCVEQRRLMVRRIEKMRASFWISCSVRTLAIFAAFKCITKPS